MLPERPGLQSASYRHRCQPDPLNHSFRRGPVALQHRRYCPNRSILHTKEHPHRHRLRDCRRRRNPNGHRQSAPTNYQPIETPVICRRSLLLWSRVPQWSNDRRERERQPVRVQRSVFDDCESRVLDIMWERVGIFARSSFDLTSNMNM